jgi:Protein of unknown function (DUF1214)
LPTASRFHRRGRGTNPSRKPAALPSSISVRPPPAGKESNWLATPPGKGYFAILRLYGPTEAVIDKSWKPGDIEKVQ